MAKEHTLVALTEDRPADGLAEGDVGTVVHVQGEIGYEVEFFNGAGGTVAVLSLPADAVRLLGDRDVLHARRLAA